jgi:hypothetical protein
MVPPETARTAGSSITEMIAAEVVARHDGGTRELARLNESDHLEYEAAVARVLPRIEASLLPGVTANRAHLRGPAIELGSWARSRSLYRARLREALPRPGAAVFIGDVRACYASITPKQVERALRRAGTRPPDAAHVGRVLRDLGDRGVSGLPIGPVPSAPLANVVLSRLDRALDTNAIAWARWVDDVVIVADGRLAASLVHDVFRRELAALGLEENPIKTMVVHDLDEAMVRLPGPRRYLRDRSARDMIRPP